MKIQNVIFLLILFVFAMPISVHAQIETTAKQALILDYETGEVLYEKNSDSRMPTSSMSKVMTMYVVFDALKNGKISLEDELLVSEKAWKKGGSKMWVEVNKKVKVEDLIRGVIIQSGNDATIVLAEGLAGSVSSFAQILNRTAKNLGMENSNFMNASGWPDPKHYSTARDLAILAKAMINDFPEYYKYYAEKEFSYSDISQPNRNPLLYLDIGADGIKTGHTEDGGYGLIGTGVKDGRRVIMVLNGMESAKERKMESSRLLQWALNGFSNVRLFSEQKNIDHIPVYLGQKSSVSVVASHDVTMTLPKLFEEDLVLSLEYQSPLKAPVMKGDKLGVVHIKRPDGGGQSVPLIAAEDVPRVSGFMAFVAKSRLLSTGEGIFD